MNKSLYKPGKIKNNNKKAEGNDEKMMD